SGLSSAIKSAISMRSAFACGIFCTWLDIRKEKLGGLPAFGRATPDLLADILPVLLSHRRTRPTIQPFQEFGFQCGHGLPLLRIGRINGIFALPPRSHAPRARR